MTHNYIYTHTHTHIHTHTHVSIVVTTGSQIFRTSRSHHKILGASRVTWSKIHTKDPQLLVATQQNLVARATWRDTVLETPSHIYLHTSFIIPSFVFRKSRRALDTGHAVVLLVEALCYKPEGRRFDSRWCHWNFSLTLSVRSHYGPGGKLSL